MSRLTKRIMDEALLKDVEFVVCKALCENMDKYDHPCDMCPIDLAIKKLAHYEDLEEQGRLIELPCKMGTPIWWVTWDYSECFVKEYYVEESTFDLDDLGPFGTFCFLTEAEAEAKLAELKGGGSDG